MPGLFFVQSFRERGWTGRESTQSSSRIKSEEESYELHIGCADCLCCGDAGRNIGHDKERGQYRAVLRWEQEYRLGRVGTEHSGNMDLGAGPVHVHRERLHEGLCRALLVPGAECTLPDIFYPVCQTDPGGNAGGHNAVRLYA